MRHLDAEDLARLADEPPTAEEAAHLGACPACAGELEAMRAQVAALGALPTLAAPAAGWAMLSRRLEAEESLATRGRVAIRRVLPRMAAAIALFVAGGVTGEVLRGPAAPAAPTAAAVSTAEDAERLLAAKEAEYVDALSRYAELTGAAAAADPVNRLAALEGIVLTTRAALKEAPADPVINGYHLTALTQREAILRQISDEPRNASDVWY